MRRLPLSNYPACVGRRSGLMLAAYLAALGCDSSDAKGTDDGSIEADDDDDDDDDDDSTSPSDDDDDDDDNGGDDDDDGGADDDDDDDPGQDTGDLPHSKFDLDDSPDLPHDDNTGECDIEHTPCDEDSDDPWHAFGINCPGEIQVDGKYTGNEKAIGVFDKKLGTYTPDTWPILEGKRYVALSTGEAESIFSLTTCDPGTGFEPIAEAMDFPAPINPKAVSGDCTTDTSLLGTGDCSKTLQAQWEAAEGTKGNDWAELRFTLKVPENVNGFAFDFAFLSVEYPVFFKSMYNDLFVAWLESDKWTGNISFDKDGQPISLNAGFLDYKDGVSPEDPSCPAPCEAPELAGTCLEGHAATKWLTTSAGVTPGETITLVFGVIDLGDDILDAIVLLDNFRWECQGGPPETNPK